MISTVRDYAADIIELSRPWACIIVTSLIIGMRLGSLTFETWPEVLTSILGVVCIVAGTFAANDWFDRSEDAYVHPGRLLPSGRRSARFVLKIGIIEFSLGMICLATVGSTTFWFGLLAISLAIAYSPVKKVSSLAGNFVIATLVALTTIYGQLNGTNVVIDSKLIALSATAFLVVLSRELIKDIEDMKQEYLFHKTLPMIIGVRAVYRMSALAYGLCILCFVAYVANIGQFLITVMHAPVILMGGSIVLRILSASADDATYYSRQMKWTMFGAVFIVVLAHI